MERLFVVFISFIVLLTWASCKHEPYGPIDGPVTGPVDTIPVLPPIVSDCDPDSIYYENTIVPLLSSSCGSSTIYCHSVPTDDNDGIVFNSYNDLINNAEEDLIIPGNANDSKMIDVIQDGDMPPDTSSFTISPENQALLTLWINQGAQNNGCNSGCDTTNVSYQDDVYPIISLVCSSCHSGSDPSGGILLTNYANISSEAVNGLLLSAISWDGNAAQMPDNGPQLDECYINLIQIWVDNGALDN
jgi:hypothetical protein